MQNIVHAASVILDTKYKNHWMRIEDLIDQGTDDLIRSIENYINVLSSSQHDTYTNPFEIVASNMGEF